MSRNILLLLVFLLVTGSAQVWHEVRVTNNSIYDDYTSPNNGWCIQANRELGTIHIVCQSDEITNGETDEIVYYRSADYGTSFYRSVVISDPEDEWTDYTPSIAFYRYPDWPYHLNVAWAAGNEEVDYDYKIRYNRSTDDGTTWEGIHSLHSSDLEVSDPSNVAGPDPDLDPLQFRIQYIYIKETEEGASEQEEGEVHHEWRNWPIYPDKEPEPELPHQLDFSEYSMLPSVAASGNFAYAVCQDDPSGYEFYQIYLQRNDYYGRGISWYEPQQISEPLSPQMVWAEYPCVAANSPYVYVVWEQYIHVQQTPYSVYIPVIYFRRSTNNGVTWEAPIQLTYGGTSPPRGNQVPVYIFEYTPSISVDGSNVCAVWQWGLGPISGPREYNIVVARSTDNGRTWPEDQKQIVGGYWPCRTNPEMNPSVSAESDVLHIVWTDLRHGFENPEIYYRKMPWRWTDGGEQNIPTEIGSFEFLNFEPNPVKDKLKIGLSIPTPTQVNVTIYDINGRVVTSLIDKKLASGTHQVIWNCKDKNDNKVKNGIYFVRLKAGTFSANEKLIVAE